MRHLFALLCVLALAGSAAAVDITTCGQSVADNDIGVLQVDLDCTAQTGVCVHRNFNDEEVACSVEADCQPPINNPCARTAVTLGAGAILQLNGHSITGAGVLCSAAGICGVSGPGSILSAPVGVLARKRVIAAEVTIDGGVYGIVSRRGGAVLSNVALTNNTLDGIWSWQGAIRANGVVATGNGEIGLYAKLKPVVARNTTVSNNGGSGIDGYPSRGANLTIQNNGGFGIVSEKGLAVRDSTITGNGVAYGGLDIASVRRPRVRNTLCDHSQNRGEGGGSWGVCALD